MNASAHPSAMTAAQPDAAPAAPGGDAFAFVQALAGELSGGKVDLPGFPDIAVRVQRVLADERSDLERVVRVIGSEPVLAGQVLQLANSAALNVSGKPVTDLRSAVTRVGLNAVRTATIAFAIRQVRRAGTLRGLEKPLDLLWQRSILNSSLCCVIARRLTRVAPETAMLAGLLHGIGRLYILTRASRHRTLFADVATYQAIERDWHLGITVALLENWEIADEIVQAVRDCEDAERDARGAPGLADVLAAAALIAANKGRPEDLARGLRDARPLARMHLTPELCESLLNDSAGEIAALRAALN